MLPKALQARQLPEVRPQSDRRSQLIHLLTIIHNLSILPGEPIELESRSKNPHETEELYYVRVPVRITSAEQYLLPWLHSKMSDHQMT